MIRAQIMLIFASNRDANGRLIQIQSISFPRHRSCGLECESHPVCIWPGSARSSGSRPNPPIKEDPLKTNKQIKAKNLIPGLSIRTEIERERDREQKGGSRFIK